jgi:hypothetical protein
MSNVGPIMLSSCQSGHAKIGNTCGQAPILCTLLIARLAGDVHNCLSPAERICAHRSSRVWLAVCTATCTLLIAMSGVHKRAQQGMGSCAHHQPNVL